MTRHRWLAAPAVLAIVLRAHREAAVGQLRKVNVAAAAYQAFWEGRVE